LRFELTLHPSETIIQFLVTPWQANRPSQIPEVMEDRPADVGPGEGGKRGSLVLVVQLGGPQQAQQTHLLEILGRFRTAVGVVPGDRSNQIEVLFKALIPFLDPGCAGSDLAANGPAGSMER
jgi:hypothetical protein